jgi:LAS superfamily LD-carboxypeptidase LdcB
MITPVPDIKQLTGQTTAHLVEFGELAQLHKETVSDWLALSVSAAYAGFELAIASSFRSFERQLIIWNQKANGERALLDAEERVIGPEEIASMSAEALLFEMLRWSALPGSSRHHWGSDIDVYDKKAVLADEPFELLASDCVVGGKFATLHEWLDKKIASNEANGFFRPYVGNNKVMHEPWHLSHKPVSACFEAELSYQLLKDFYQGNAQIALNTEIADNFEAIYTQYICIAN